MRLFVVDGAEDGWTELTAGGEPTVRLAASDLQRAQCRRARIRSDRAGVEVILDITVAVASDFRSVRDLTAVDDGTLRYAGTVAGLTGLMGLRSPPPLSFTSRKNHSRLTRRSLTEW